MTTHDLKPCPFCGGKDVEVTNVLETEPEMAYFGLTKDNWNILCKDCYATGGTRRTALEAIEAWNRRVSDENDCPA